MNHHRLFKITCARLTPSKNGGQALLGIPRARAFTLHLFLVSSPGPLCGCCCSPGSGPAPDSEESLASGFPHRVKELSCQLYSTLIIQAMWQEILCILFCLVFIINRDTNLKDETTFGICEKFRSY